MKICLGSRSSDLARLQSHLVAQKLLESHSELQIDFLFRESFGDKNLDLDLSKTGEKGVFTQDLKELLESKKCDALIHSWKDLPIEDCADSEIVATLDRADPRDLLLFKKSSLGKRNPVFLSSSPRREFHVKKHLQDLLNFPTQSLQFKAIRGNIPTRFEKFLNDSEADAFIVAKAAWDRLLDALKKNLIENPDLLNSFKYIQENCEFMVLPVKLFPPAPSQGALAIEIRKEDKALKEIFQSINVSSVFSSVLEERKIMKQRGGGCHSSLGVYHDTHPHYTLCVESGENDYCQNLESKTQESPQEFSKHTVISSREFFNESSLKRIPLQAPLQEVDSEKLYLISHYNESAAFLAKENLEKTKLWSSGLTTWKHLAKAGYWVSGSFESLGEDFFKDSWSSLFSSECLSFKLSHIQSEKNYFDKKINLYEIQFSDNYFKSLDHEKYQTIYWQSASQFSFLWKNHSEILKAKTHFSGAGKTHQELKKHFKPSELFIFNSYEDCLNSQKKAPMNKEES